MSRILLGAVVVMGSLGLVACVPGSPTSSIPTIESPVYLSTQAGFSANELSAHNTTGVYGCTTKASQVQVTLNQLSGLSSLSGVAPPEVDVSIEDGNMNDGGLEAITVGQTVVSQPLQAFTCFVVNIQGDLEQVNLPGLGLQFVWPSLNATVTF